ncbi:Glycosylated lysosomal membrane protein [Labeo rohita]|uniref:Glycosylated lysosomal membrane protein n=1 Tax=Labeo rohita TaxID=84645 RepID=A0ABQ8LUC9_LABRO|nr:Glycosylated lysosomal membrane protein [Labeo rohita]
MATCKVNFIFSVVFVVFGAALGFLGSGDTFRRKVSVELNPGLKPPSVLPPEVGLVHVRGLGLNDTLHFLICNRGAPALLLVHTNSTQSTVQVNWPNFINHSLSGSLKVEPQDSVQYSSALVWEYDDVNDTADPQQTAESSFYPPYELQNFTWSNLSINDNQSDPTVMLCGGKETESFLNGTLCLQFSAFESEGREKAWPSLLHNANSSQLRVWLNGVTPRGNSSRFALEFHSVGESEFQGRVDVAQWVSFPVNSSGVRGYNQWKPVAYRKAEPAFEDATPCKHSRLVSVNHIPDSGLVQAYFTDNPQTHGLNISFGIAKDPVTVLMGVGEPPAESFSTLIIIIIAVGLGTPLALIIVGGVFVWIRKRMSHSSVYEPIN